MNKFKNIKSYIINNCNNFDTIEEAVGGFIKNKKIKATKKEIEQIVHIYKGLWDELTHKEEEKHNQLFVEDEEDYFVDPMDERNNLMGFVDPIDKPFDVKEILNRLFNESNDITFSDEIDDDDDDSSDLDYLVTEDIGGFMFADYTEIDRVTAAIQFICGFSYKQARNEFYSTLIGRTALSYMKNYYMYVGLNLYTAEQTEGIRELVKLVDFNMKFYDLVYEFYNPETTMTLTSINKEIKKLIYNFALEHEDLGILDIIKDKDRRGVLMIVSKLDKLDPRATFVPELICSTAYIEPELDFSDLIE